MTIKKLRVAVKNLTVYLEECHGEDDTVIFTAKVVKSIKENYEELIKYKEIDIRKEDESNGTYKHQNNL